MNGGVSNCSIAGFESLEQLPSLFVLMGNFHSFSCTAASTDYAAVKANFASFGMMLSQHERIMVSVTQDFTAAYHSLRSQFKGWLGSSTMQLYEEPLQLDHSYINFT